MEETISFNCPACGARFKAPMTAAGRSAPCSHCGRVVSVPAVFEEAPDEAPPAPPLPQVFDAPRPHAYQPPPAFHKKQNVIFQIIILLLALGIMASGVGVIWYTAKNGHFPWVDAPASETPALPGKTKPATTPTTPAVKPTAQPR